MIDNLIPNKLNLLKTQNDISITIQSKKHTEVLLEPALAYKQKER